MCFGRKQPTKYNLVSSKVIVGDELCRFIKNKFPTASLWLSDAQYTLCHYDDVAYFLAQSQINNLQYTAEDMDCDDFAAALWGEFSVPPWSKLAIGYLWTEVHALNCVVTEDMRFLFLEPQTNELQEDLVSWQGSQPRLIII